MDVGEKSEGIVNIKEFPTLGDKLMIQVGDMIDVVVKGPDPTPADQLVLSGARRRKALMEVEAAIRDHTPSRASSCARLKAASLSISGRRFPAGLAN